MSDADVQCLADSIGFLRFWFVLIFVKDLFHMSQQIGSLNRIVHEQFVDYDKDRLHLPNLLINDILLVYIDVFEQGAVDAGDHLDKVMIEAIAEVRCDVLPVGFE
jgi:hypothetical protein